MSNLFKKGFASIALASAMASGMFAGDAAYIDKKTNYLIHVEKDKDVRCVIGMAKQCDFIQLTEAVNGNISSNQAVLDIYMKINPRDIVIPDAFSGSVVENDDTNANVTANVFYGTMKGNPALDAVLFVNNNSNDNNNGTTFSTQHIEHPFLVGKKLAVNVEQPSIMLKGKNSVYKTTFWHLVSSEVNTAELNKGEKSVIYDKPQVSLYATANEVEVNTTDNQAINKLYLKENIPFMLYSAVSATTDKDVNVGAGSNISFAESNFITLSNLSKNIKKNTVDDKIVDVYATNDTDLKNTKTLADANRAYVNNNYNNTENGDIAYFIKLFLKIDSDTTGARFLVFHYGEKTNIMTYNSDTIKALSDKYSLIKQQTGSAVVASIDNTENGIISKSAGATSIVNRDYLRNNIVIGSSNYSTNVANMNNNQENTAGNDAVANIDNNTENTVAYAKFVLSSDTFGDTLRVENGDRTSIGLSVAG